MQQFTIPQFIDVEDKIIGPITTRQFVIMIAGAVFIAIFYRFFDFALFLTLTITTAAVCIVLAFVKINGRPFHLFVLNLVQTLGRPGLRVWNHTLRKTNISSEKDTAKDIIETKVVKNGSLPQEKTRASSRLAELSLIVDTRGVYKGEEKSGGAAIVSGNNK